MNRLGFFGLCFAASAAFQQVVQGVNGNNDNRNDDGPLDKFAHSLPSLLHNNAIILI
jgi:hypothetical protein